MPELFTYRDCDCCPWEGETAEDDEACPNCGNCLCSTCQGERELEREQASENAFEGYPDEPEEEDVPTDDGERERSPAMDERARPIPARATTGALYLPALPGRPIRPMSFEQEIGKGSERVAARMFDRCYAPDSYVHGYGSSRSRDRDHEDRGTFVHVEHDSSCGGEVIYSRLDLNQDRAARAFESAFGIVADLHASGDVVLNMRCGFHIHIGIQGFGMRAIENLYHAHNHLEDVLFRLGSANWRAHRTEVADTDYAPTTPKDLKGKTSIGHMLESSRYALNLSNYLASRGHCHCGAFAFADWEGCTCTLPKATVEFRWPNATTNLRKVHAYASLLQSLVAACDRAGDGEFSNLAALGYSGSGSPHALYLWEDRAEWMGANLTMTANEWDSVAYCFERSSLFGAHGAYLANKVRAFQPATAELVAF